MLDIKNHSYTSRINSLYYDNGKYRISMWCMSNCIAPFNSPNSHKVGETKSESKCNKQITKLSKESKNFLNIKNAWLFRLFRSFTRRYLVLVFQILLFNQILGRKVHFWWNCQKNSATDNNAISLLTVCEL